MSIEIEELTPAHDVEVEAFLDDLGRSTPAVLAYHYPFYREMLRGIGIGTPLYLGARRGGSLIGLLPAFVRETAIGSAFCSLPFFGPNAGVLCATDVPNVEVHDELIRHFLARARKAQALSCSIYTPLLLSDFGHYDSLRPDVVVERFTQCSEIDDAGWNGFIRNRLRRAERMDVTISTENTPTRFNDFYQIYSDNCRDYSIPLKPRECLEQILTPQLLGRRVRLYYAIHNDEMIGALLLLCSPSTVSYYIPCTRHDMRNLQPGTVLVDRAFHDARAEGARVWNWESSPSRDSGVYEYKRKWGAAENGYRVYVWCHRGVDCLRQIGREQLMQSFPHFFIFPFDRLSVLRAG